MTDYQQFLDILPQEYPFRMIDEIIDYEEGKSLTAIKNITGSEWVFEGKEPGQFDHFPETLIIEAAAQAALVLYHIIKVHKTVRKVSYRIGKINFNFFEKVMIGEQIEIRAFVVKILNNGGFSKILIKNSAKKVANVDLYYSVIDAK